MSVALTAARVAAGLNIVLLAVLASIWIRNYRQVQSKQTLGSLLFALLLLAENGLAFYYYNFSSISLSLPAVRAMMYLQILEAAAILILTLVFWE